MKQKNKIRKLYHKYYKYYVFVKESSIFTKMKKIISTFLLLTLLSHILSSQWIINRDTSLIFSENNTQFTSALSRRN